MTSVMIWNAASPLLRPADLRYAWTNMGFLAPFYPTEIMK